MHIIPPSTSNEEKPSYDWLTHQIYYGNEPEAIQPLILEQDWEEYYCRGTS